ncbi:MAG: PD-(D/E)XK nuclease-like domain-containing protein [Deltaproteobacteria bacterium]|nr:PD-(D/E)XK nuclease-like domain-containing protein [Deltaproteobacteria bacterium]
MKPGIYYDVPMEEYKKWPGVHKSMFHSILRSGLQLKYDTENEPASSPIMVFGNLVDCLLFEPQLFAERYKLTPETYPAIVKKISVNKPWNWNATYCKEWRDEQPDGIEIVTGDEVSQASMIKDRILNHPEAGRWLLRSQRQVSIFWIDQDTSLPCKGRIDALPEDLSRIVDLKVTADPLPFAFSGIIRKFLYHAGGAFYHDGYFLAQGKDPGPGPQLPFSFIAAEADLPHDVVTYDLGPESFEVGRIVYRDALARYKEIIENNEFCGYSNVVEEIEIPRWALNRIQMEGIIE